MSKCVETLMQVGERLFTSRGSLISLWQEISDNFYPERADFTASRSLGTEFAAHLMTSYPILARRDLANSLGTMLRPTSKEWMKITVRNAVNLSNDARRWLEFATKTQKKAMYDRRAMFVRATKEGDNDFATFGQTVISVERNRDNDGLIYRCWHLRDVAWAENVNGEVDTVFRRWKPTARDLVSLFPKTVDQKVKDKLDKDPFCEFNVWHVVMPAERYAEMKGDKQFRTPYVSVFIDVDNKVELECVGSWTLKYVIPRWQTVSGSQYAYSPATIAALPDGRLIQSMTRVLLEAGEKAVDPPMIAVQEAIRSDVAIYAGGITWVDPEYDEKLGEVLRPISGKEGQGISIGLEMLQATQSMITEAFYLNKLTLPQSGDEMTAYEVGQRVQEYIRQALPIFEPMESEYNGALCDMTFIELLRGGAFGSMHDLPADLQGVEIEFEFESPLRDATERAKAQRFIESKELLAVAAELDPSAPSLVDAKTALRDVLVGIGVPAKWMNSEAQVAAAEAEMRQQQQAQQMLALAQQGADVAATAGAVE